MEDIKQLFNYYKEHKGAIVALIVSLIVGGAPGAAAFFNGWLG